MTDPGYPPSMPRPFPPQRRESGAATLVLGILSIVFAGPIGFVLGLIALSMAKRVFVAAAGGYAEPGALDQAKAGRICAIIGVVIGSISFAFFCLWFSCLGAAIMGGTLGGAAGAGGGGAPSP